MSRETRRWRVSIAADPAIGVGSRARITGGENRGYSGMVTHLYRQGVFAGLVVLDDNRVAEFVDIQAVR